MGEQIDLSELISQLARIANNLELLRKAITDNSYTKDHFIIDKASNIFCNNECPAGQEQIKIQQSIKKAEQLYDTLSRKYSFIENIK